MGLYYKGYTDRIILFFEDESSTEGYWTTHWESHTVMLYYCYLIDPIKAEKLYKALVGSWRYSVSNNMPLDTGFPEDEDDVVYLPIEELSEVINFLDTEILPTLEQEVNNGQGNDILVDRWSGGVNFDTFLLNSVGGIFTNDSIESHVQMDETPEYLLNSMSDLKDFFQTAVNNNLKYYVIRE
jgi:hypothetical protein